MQSLFIISLPRSLSTQVHALCCDALGLRSPTWTSAGEILNFDRSALLTGKEPRCQKYLLGEQTSSFRSTHDFLDEVVAREGFAYKDVIQPFVVSRWLGRDPGVAVLKIVPNLCHVAFAMMNRDWFYPAVAATGGHNLTSRLLSGLMRAADALESVPGESVHYDDLISGFEPVREALGRLYPERPIGAMELAPDFAQVRDEILHRRTLGSFARLRDTEAELRAAA